MQPVSALQANAFCVLGVTVRDDRRRIVEVADEKSLEMDATTCQKLRAELTVPRSRLSAEIGWLPGLSPARAADLARRLPLDLLSLSRDEKLPLLAKANLLASSLEVCDAGAASRALGEAISMLAEVAEYLDPEVILRQINEDRAIAAFPEVKDVDVVQEELAKQRRRFRDAAMAVLERIPSKALVALVTEVVDRAVGTEEDLPKLVEALIDGYELQTQPFLQAEAASVEKLIVVAKDLAQYGESDVEPVIDELETVIRNWDWVAQPIQLTAKARGLDHRPSHALAGKIRGLAVDLFNKHDFLATSRRLTSLVGDVFAEVPKSADQVEQDVKALDDIVAEREEAAAQRKKWEEEITFSTSAGIYPPSVLAISPSGVSCWSTRIPLDRISRVRWGGVRHSVNGIPTGTTYTIAVGDDNDEIEVTFRQGDVYSAFTDKLWRATAPLLLKAMLQKLKEGSSLQFGDSTIHDEGITLRRRGWVRTGEPIRYAWSDIQVWSQGGSFFVDTTADKKVRAELSYLKVPNVHYLEHAIRLALKQGADRLSDLLNDE